MEQWRAITDWEGFYEVSNLGRVRSVDRIVPYGRSGRTKYTGRILKPGTSTGYAVVTLVETGRGIREQYYVHDLVLETFVGAKPAGKEVCHGPKGPLDNAVSNLRYDTRSMNALDRHKWGAGWPTPPRKPPTHVRCAVCQTDMWVYRRRTAFNHICGPECRRIWGRICMEKK